MTTVRVNKSLIAAAPKPARTRPSKDHGLHKAVQALKFAALTIALVSVFLFFKPSFDQIRDNKLSLNRLSEDIAQKQKLVETLRREQQSLHSDPEHIERIARDKLNLARPDEYVYRFEPKNSIGNTPP